MSPPRTRQADRRGDTEGFGSLPPSPASPGSVSRKSAQDESGLIKREGATSSFLAGDKAGQSEDLSELTTRQETGDQSPSGTPASREDGRAIIKPEPHQDDIPREEVLPYIYEKQTSPCANRRSALAASRETTPPASLQISPTLDWDISLEWQNDGSKSVSQELEHVNASTISGSQMLGTASPTPEQETSSSTGDSGTVVKEEHGTEDAAFPSNGYHPSQSEHHERRSRSPRSVTRSPGSGGKRGAEALYYRKLSTERLEGDSVPDYLETKELIDWQDETAGVFYTPVPTKRRKLADFRHSQDEILSGTPSQRTRQYARLNLENQLSPNVSSVGTVPDCREIKAAVESEMRDLRSLCDILLPTPQLVDATRQCNSKMCVEGQPLFTEEPCHCYNCAAFRYGLYSTSDVDNSVNCSKGYSPRNPNWHCDCPCCLAFKEGLDSVGDELVLPGEIATHLTGVIMSSVFLKNGFDARLERIALALVDNHLHAYKKYLGKAARLLSLVNGSDLARLGNVNWRKTKKSGEQRLTVTTVVPVVHFKDGSYLEGYEIEMSDGFFTKTETVKFHPALLQKKLANHKDPHRLVDELSDVFQKMLAVADKILRYNDKSPKDRTHVNSKYCKYENYTKSVLCRCSRCVAYREGSYYTIDNNSYVDCSMGPNEGAVDCCCDGCVCWREGKELAPYARNVCSGVTAYLVGLGMASVFRRGHSLTGLKPQDRWGHFPRPLDWCIRLAGGYFIPDILEFVKLSHSVQGVLGLSGLAAGEGSAVDMHFPVDEESGGSDGHVYLTLIPFIEVEVGKTLVDDCKGRWMKIGAALKGRAVLYGESP